MTGSRSEAWRGVLQGMSQGASDAFPALLEALEATHNGSTADRVEQILPHTDLDSVTAEEPFAYQNELIGSIHELFQTRPTTALLSLPTGGGKTATATRAIIELLNTGVIKRCLWAAPARELLDQAHQTFIRYWRANGTAEGVRLTACHQGADFAWTADRQISLVTLQMLSKRVGPGGRQKDFSADCLVVDEAHHAAAPTYHRALDGLRDNVGVLLGLSATPGRREYSSSMDLLSLFSRNLLTAPSLGRHPVRALQDAGVLSRLTFHQVRVDSRIPGIVRGATHTGVPSGQLAAHPARLAAAVQAVAEASAIGRVLVFAHDLAHAAALTALLRDRGINAGALSGNLGVGERERTLGAFATGALTVLVNVRVLTAGYDLPALPSIVLAAPVASPILFEQMVGRVTRGPLVGGTAEGHVWQLDDHLKMHGLPRSYHRFGDLGWE
jgi:DNA repair protein RadD